MSRPSPVVAASLSFVVPGLGQLAEGARRAALVFGLPALAVFGILVTVALRPPASILEVLVRPEVLVALLVLNVLALAFHVAAVVDAYRRAEPQRPPRLSTGPRHALVVLIALAVLGHGAIGYVGLHAYEALEAVFEPGGGWQIPQPGFDSSPSPAVNPSPSPSPTLQPSPSARPSPSPTPTPTPSPLPAWASDGRLDLLLIGSDAGPDRWSLRTDTMIVLSVDVTTGRAAIFGIPRNMTGVPLAPESASAFPNGRFPGLLNALYVYATGHPARFPGGDARGFRAVTGAVQELVGVRLDGTIVVDLAGFVRLVDAIGGLWIDVPARLVDPRYPLEDGSGSIAIDIRPGCQRLDGRMVLAYARSRRQDSDYGRMTRQQVVLVALRRQVDPLALVAQVPQLLDIARDHLWTTLARDDLAELARLAARVDPGSIRSFRFVPPTFRSPLTDATIGRLRTVVRDVFAGPSPAAPASPNPTGTLPSGDNGCG